MPEIDFTQHVQDDGTTISTVERVVKDVQAPAFYKPTDEQFFSREDPSKPDIAFLKNHFYREGRLTDDQGKATHGDIKQRTKATGTAIQKRESRHPDRRLSLE